MNRHAIASIVAWAIGSFALALAVGLPARLSADDPSPTTKPTIAAPTLTVNGVTLQLSRASNGALALTGTNTNSTTVTTPFTVEGVNYSSAPGSRTSTSTETFTQSGTITLAPRQRNTIVIRSNIPGQTSEVELSSGDNTISYGDNASLSAPLARPATQPSDPVAAASPVQAAAPAVVVVRGSMRPMSAGIYATPRQARR